MAHKVWGARIDPKIVELVRNYCSKNRILMQTFIEDALIEKMEGKRYVFTGKTSKRSK